VSDVQKLSEHIASQHSSRSRESQTVKEIKCQKCNFMCHDDAQLDSHMQENPHVCSECAVDFSTRDGLEKHMNEHHKYSCSLCLLVLSARLLSLSAKRQ